MESGYKLVSRGVVVEDKPRGVPIAKVSPIEIFYDQASGDINKNKQQLVGSLADLSPAGTETEHESVNWIRARWVGASNRATAPDVKTGEKVNIYTYPGTLTYYWDVAGGNELMRGKEDHVMVWSNREGGDPNGEEPTMDNNVSMRVNTIDKFVELKTPVNDGEPAGFNFKIDMKSGSWSCSDSNGNYITMDAVGSILKAFTNEEILGETKHVGIKCKTIVTDCDTGTVNANDLVEVTSPMTRINGDLEVNGDATINGNLTVSGNLEVGGNMTGGTGSGGGTANFNGLIHTTDGINTDGDAHFKGNLKVDGSATGSFPGPKA